MIGIDLLTPGSVQFRLRVLFEMAVQKGFTGGKDLGQRQQAICFTTGFQRFMMGRAMNVKPDIGPLPPDGIRQFRCIQVLEKIIGQ